MRLKDAVHSEVAISQKRGTAENDLACILPQVAAILRFVSGRSSRSAPNSRSVRISSHDVGVHAKDDGSVKLDRLARRSGGLRDRRTDRPPRSKQSGVNRLLDERVANTISQ